MTDTKTCTKCGEVKPVEAFSIINKSTGNRVSWCKVCRAAYMRVWHANRRRLSALPPAPERRPEVHVPGKRGGQKIRIYCAECSKPFTRYACEVRGQERAGGGRPTYCSHACAAAGRRRKNLEASL